MVRRLENIFGEDDLNKSSFSKNAIVSVFQSRSLTSLDKKV